MQTLKIKLSILAFIILPFFVSAQIFNTDVIVKGSICVGFDCITGENFGFDTQRFKENNLRIHFDDTSNSASFPANDWRITINDSGNGGTNYFGIDDATAGTRPFMIEAGAGNNALHVDATVGNVGMGTNNPVVELHVTDGDSPTIRLEQNTANGWIPQTWDIVGNETNFFIRDVTGGSKLPFRIKPGAPSNSIFINPNGNITLGAQDDNDEKLTVKGNISLDGDIHFRDSNADKFRLSYENSKFLLKGVDSENNIIVVNEDAEPNTLYLHDSGAVSIGSSSENSKLYVDGGLIVNGDIHALSDRRIKKNITDLKYGLSDVLKLSAKQYDFDNTGYNLNLSKNSQLGLIAQEVQSVIPEVVTNDINIEKSNGELGSLKGVNYTALIPVLIQAIQEQQLEIQEKNSEILSIKSQLDQLNAKVDALVNQMGQNNEQPVSQTQTVDQDNVVSQDLKTSPSKSNPTEEKLNNGRTQENISKHQKKGSQ